VHQATSGIIGPPRTWRPTQNSTVPAQVPLRASLAVPLSLCSVCWVLISPQPGTVLIAAFGELLIEVAVTWRACASRPKGSAPRKFAYFPHQGAGRLFANAAKSGNLSSGAPAD
jgi:hypothetical protein